MNIDSIILKFFHDKSNIYVKDLLFNWKQYSKSSKTSTENNMINFVINSEQFNDYISMVFEQSYCMYFEKNDVIILKLKNMFLQEIVRKNKIFVKDQLNEYIKDTEEFKEYYYKLVKSLASFLLNKNKKEIEDKQVYEIIQSFKEINLNDYCTNSQSDSPLQIVNDILSRFIIEKFNNGEENTENVLNKIHQKDREYFIIRHQKQFGKHSSLNNDIVRFEEFCQNKTNLIDIYFNVIYNEIND